MQRNEPTILDKIREYRKKMFTTYKQITEDNRLQIKRQKKPGEAVKETSRRVRPERFNKWPNSMLAK